jgi:hypothetical protein
MINTAILNQQTLCGLFELDPAGTVLYSRMETDGRSSAAALDVAGHNFFDEVAPFENAEELRLRISSFTRGECQADNFQFTCRFNDDFLPVKVLLARIRERTNGRRTKSILVHIRKI